MARRQAPRAGALPGPEALVRAHRPRVRGRGVLVAGGVWGGGAGGGRVRVGGGGVVWWWELGGGLYLSKKLELVVVTCLDICHFRIPAATAAFAPSRLHPTPLPPSPRPPPPSPRPPPPPHRPTARRRRSCATRWAWRCCPRCSSGRVGACCGSTAVSPSWSRTSARVSALRFVVCLRAWTGRVGVDG